MHESYSSTKRKEYYGLAFGYFGSGFVGWQRQSTCVEESRSSVQDLLESALTKVLGHEERVNITSVSRTDAGTHAASQFGVFSLTTLPICPAKQWMHNLNERLPSSIRVYSLELLKSFTPHPLPVRARCKRYLYFIQQGYRPNLELCKYSWYIRKQMNADKLQEALNYLVGTHDFRPFSQGLQKFEAKRTVRTIIRAKVILKKTVAFCLDPKVCGAGEVLDFISPLENTNGSATGSVYFICIELIADGFLRHMIRRIIGSLRSIGEETANPKYIRDVLQDLKEAGPSAPAKGLWLHKIWLTDEEWQKDSLTLVSP